MHSFPVVFFFRGEKDFSILEALHFFHTLEVFLELFGAEVVLVYESTFVDVCFLLTRHVQSSSCVAVIDARQSAARHTRHVCSDPVPVHPAHFQHPLNFLFIPSFLFSLTLFLSLPLSYLFPTFPIFSQNFLFSLTLTLSADWKFFVSYFSHIWSELPTLSYNSLTLFKFFVFAMLMAKFCIFL